MTRPHDIEAAVLLIRSVFPGTVVLCSFCGENEADASSTWCEDCDSMLAEHVEPLLSGGILSSFGPAGRKPRFTPREPRLEPPSGVCAWCSERPATEGYLCSECDAGTDTSIGVPITDREVRAAGFIPTARGWVPRTPELRQRLEAADRARTAEREAVDERAAAIRRVIRRVRRTA